MPGLADLPVISADGLTYTFTIKPDIPFVRHGEVVRTMTADDAVFSINRLLRPDVTPYPSPIGPSYLTAVTGAQAVLDGTAQTATGITALDEHTVQVDLDHPDRGVLNILASSFGAVVPPELAGTDAAKFGADPVGTGTLHAGVVYLGRRREVRAQPSLLGAGHAQGRCHRHPAPRAP